MPRKRTLLSGNTCLSASTRRRFLQGSGAAIAGITLANCRPNLVDAPSESEPQSLSANGGDRSSPLHVFTWAGYIHDDLITAFSERTGIEVIVDIYDSNETMLAKMQAGGGNAYSVIYPSDYMVQQMIELGLLVQLDKDRIEGLDNIFDQWQDPVYDSGNSFSIPFAWGTTGLLYNREAVTSAPEDWDYLWDNQADLSRRITLLNDVRETLGAVLKSLGYSYNSTDPSQIEAAYNRLMELRPAIASFISFGYEDALLGGDLSLVMAYSGDAIAATLEDERMEYIVPSSGSSVWTDTLIIPTTAPNVDAAYEWINFNLDPRISQMNTELLFNATPNKVAFDNLSDELKNNTDLFPTPEVLARCEGIAPVGDATALYDAYWTRITGG